VAVVVVTDSSARLPADIAGRHGIRVVPLHILVDGTDLRDGTDEMPADLYDRNATTAGATPAELREEYRRLVAEGNDVVAVHISGELSGTCRAAMQAAAEFGGRVQVVDSRSAAMGTGLVALAAARCAATDADVQTVAAQARSVVSGTHSYIVVHRLDSLRRSGRISGAAAWLGTALSLKPLLRIDDGQLVLAQRVRTAGKAVATMVDQVCAIAGDQQVAIAVHHVDDPGGAAGLAAILAQRLPAAQPAVVTDLGPVLALHVGRGALGVVVQLPS
jgi:DegV family protein with EDD domain